MKVLAINGSPRKGGNTEILLNTVLDTVKQHGFDTEIIQIGGTNIHGCRACGVCKKELNRKCAFDDDILNGILEKVFSADAIILGTPAYFADMTPELKSFIDRVGVIGRANGKLLKHKVGAAVVAQRKGGAVGIQATLHHMFLISEMIIPGSTYWNFAFGASKGEVLEDEEGINNMKNLGENIVWLLEKLNK